MAKNKDINISPSKGISIIIKNDFQQPPPIKPKKKRKYKRKTNLDLLKMPTMPSYIPAGDVSYIKPQYAMSSLNRNMMLPSFPQSLPPPPMYPQLTAPPQLPQLPAPPINFNLDGSFSKMLENMMMPREYGYKSQSYAPEFIDEDIMDALPKAQQDKYIEKKIAPQIEEQMKDIEFDNEDDKIKISKEVINIKASKALGTRHANNLQEYDSRFDGNDYYKQNYISRLQEIINQDAMKTRSGITKTITTGNKNTAKELLKILGIQPELKVVIPEYVPSIEQVAPLSTPPRTKPHAQVIHPEKAEAAKIEAAKEKAKTEAETKAKAEAAKEKAKEEAAKAEAAKEKAKEEAAKAEAAKEKAKAEAAKTTPKVEAAKGGPPPPPPGGGPPPPPPPPGAAAAAPAAKLIAPIDEKALIAAGAIPLNDDMKKVLEKEPSDPMYRAGWSIGLAENDDVLDYLQDVIIKISEDEEFMNDLEKSKGSGKIKFYKKYLEISALFKYNNVTKIKKTAWDMFLETNEKLQPEFKNEPEPIKEVKEIDAETLKKKSEMAKSRGGLGAKYDVDNKKEEGEKKNKEREAAMLKQDEIDKAIEDEKLRKAEERKKKKK
jgi:hypothetical protein